MRISGTRRMPVVVVVVVVVVLAVGVVAALWLRDHRRDQEWAHGGDGVDARARITATGPAGFGDALVAAGVGREAGIARAAQMYVVHVSWSGTPDQGGSYEFLLLDRRLSPPTPVRGFGVWDAEGGTGSNWSGAYESLADHYPWLARTASQHTDQGWTNDTDALGVDATDSGDGTLAYYLDPGQLETSSPERDLLLAMVFVDADGEVRWARKVPLTSLI